MPEERGAAARVAEDPNAQDPKTGSGLARGEIAELSLAWLFFFCVLGSYYVLRPIRDAFGVARGVQDLKWLYTGTFVAMLIASPCFSALAAHGRPRALVAPVLHFFAFNLLVFYALLRALPDEARYHVGNVFFVWTSVFNLFAVSVFWSFMADLHRPEAGRKFFGLIASGGSAGGFAGAFLTERLVDDIGPAALLLVSVGLLEGAVVCAALLRRRAECKHGESGEDGGSPPPPVAPGFLEGAALLLRSRYLLGICAYMLLTTICASIVYYQRGAIVAEALHDAVERARAFAAMDRTAQLLIFVLQALAAGPLLRRLGASRTLCILPLVYALGFTAVGFLPALAAINTFEVTRRVVGYGVAAPTREYLFTLVTRHEKYASKNFIDTAVWRGGDLLGAFLADALAAAGGRLSLLALSALPLCGLWLAVAGFLGRRSDRRGTSEALRERPPD